MHRLPNHVPRLSSQWFGPRLKGHATYLVGLIPIPTSCRSRPVARTSGTACNVELTTQTVQITVAKISGKLHQPSMHNVNITACSEGFQNFPGTCPEVLRNLPGNLPEFPWNSPESGNSKPNHLLNLLPELARNFRNLPGISGRFPGIFPEFSLNLAKTFPEMPQDLFFGGGGGGGSSQLLQKT